MEKKHAAVTVAALKNQDTFSQFFKLTPPTQKLHHERGELFGLIQVSEMFGEKAKDLHEQTIRLIEETYFQNQDGRVLEILERTLSRVYSQGLKLLTQKYPTNSLRGAPFSLIVIVVWGKVLYIASMGENRALLWRKGKTAEFPKVIETNTRSQDQILTSSGLLEDDDLIILATRTLLKHFDAQKLFEPYQSQKSILPQDFITYIEKTDYPSHFSDTLAVLKIDFSNPKKKQIQELSKQSIRLGISNKYTSLKGYLKLAKLNIEGRLKSLADKIRNRVKKQPKDLPQSNIYLKSFSKESPSRKKVLTAAFILLVMLFGSIWLTIRANQHKEVNQLIEQKTVKIIEQITAIKAKIEQNPQSAIEEFVQLQKLIDEVKLEGATSEELQNIESEAEVIRKTLFQISDFTSNRTLQELDDNQRFIITKNEQGGALGMINLTTNAYERISLNDSQNMQKYPFSQQNLSPFGASSGPEQFMYSLTQGVLELRTKDQNEANLTTLIQPYEEWGNIIQMDTYEANIYLLDAENKQVWKHVPTDAGYSAPFAYLKEPIEPDKTPVAFTIDGSVYVAFQDGVIRKYVGGQREDFFVNGIDKPLSDQLEMVSKAESDRLIILDKVNQRVVLVDKQGNYQRQYELSQIVPDAFDIALSEDGISIYVLSKSRLVHLGL